MSNLKDRDGNVHMPMVPGQLPFLLAHCDAIGANHTGQTWKPEDTVDERVTCMHCIADIKKSLWFNGPYPGLEKLLEDNSVRELQEAEDKRFMEMVDAEIASRERR